MRKYNLFDNFLCLVIGAIFAIFIYINFFECDKKTVYQSDETVINQLKSQLKAQKELLIEQEKELLNNKVNINNKGVNSHTSDELITSLTEKCAFLANQNNDFKIEIDNLKAQKNNIVYQDRPFETIKYVDKPVYIDKPFETIKYIDKPIEIIKEVLVNDPQLLNKISDLEVQLKLKPKEVLVDRPFETIKYIDKPIEKIVYRESSKNMTQQEKKDLIDNFYKALLNSTRSQYLYKTGIKDVFDNFKY